jgi:GntR family transcriptional regulator
MPARPQVVANLIQHRIATGDLGPGETLPSVNDLAADYRASPDELRLALAHLVSAGLIAFRDDRSAIVRQPPTLTHVMSTAASYRKALPSRDDKFTAEASEVGVTSTQRTEISVGHPSLEVADQLAIDVERQVVHRRTVRVANGRPSILEDAYRLHDPNLNQVDDVDQQLDVLGYVRAGWRDAITAHLPNSDEAELLEIDPDQPVLAHTRVLYALRIEEQEVRPVGYTRTIYVGDCNRLVYEHKQSDLPHLEERTP